MSGVPRPLTLAETVKLYRDSTRARHGGHNVREVAVSEGGRSVTIPPGYSHVMQDCLRTAGRKSGEAMEALANVGDCMPGSARQYIERAAECMREADAAFAAADAILEAVCRGEYEAQRFAEFAVRVARETGALSESEERPPSAPSSAAINALVRALTDAELMDALDDQRDAQNAYASALRAEQARRSGAAV